MITALERLVAAINGEKSDRIPIFCNLLDQGAKELGLTPHEYYSSGANVAEAQIRMRAKFGYDNLWSLFYVGKEAELLGCEKIRFALNGPPNVEDYVIKSWDDVEKLQIPDDITTHPAFEQQRICLDILRREADGKVPICAYITSTMTLPVLLMGMEMWMELLFIGPADIRNVLLEKCHEFFVKELKAYRDGGANVLVYSNPFGSPETVPMRFFLEHSLPWIERDIQAVGTTGIVYYCGMSRFNRVLDAVIARTGIGVYYLSPLDDVAEGKRIVAGRGLTCGVINDIRLVDWSVDEIHEEVRRLIEAGMPGSKFLFGTGVMPACIPDGHIRAMLDAAYEYGSWENRG